MERQQELVTVVQSAPSPLKVKDPCTGIGNNHARGAVEGLRVGRDAEQQVSVQLVPAHLSHGCVRGLSGGAGSVTEDPFQLGEEVSPVGRGDLGEADGPR